ncbi:hypothetical protein BDY17DRAFT_5779 [Neohortaea acidophila]|uniref:Uncharacterized protein n=1 Tax=Neohortaea acidophila TaxID=245834 RepID=A0A6A6Q415_9PEZI|nr:uncharacterized protein BDY17DRAFT_5779 [Neohortaea acidophila]KAF2487198.1 hypothetical protein BDY17DRAFT_5779 [Neohortaea acidophila]
MVPSTTSKAPRSRKARSPTPTPSPKGLSKASVSKYKSGASISGSSKSVRPQTRGSKQSALHNRLMVKKLNEAFDEEENDILAQKLTDALAEDQHQPNGHDTAAPQATSPLHEPITNKSQELNNPTKRKHVGEIFQPAKRVQILAGLALPPGATSWGTEEPGIEILPAPLNGTLARQEAARNPPQPKKLEIVDPEKYAFDDQFAPPTEHERHRRQIESFESKAAELKLRKEEKDARRAAAFQKKKEADMKKLDPYAGLPDAETEDYEKGVAAPVTTPVTEAQEKPEPVPSVPAVVPAAPIPAASNKRKHDDDNNDTTSAPLYKPEIKRRKVNPVKSRLFTSLAAAGGIVPAPATPNGGEASLTSAQQAQAKSISALEQGKGAGLANGKGEEPVLRQGTEQPALASPVAPSTTEQHITLPGSQSTNPTEDATPGTQPRPKATAAKAPHAANQSTPIAPNSEGNNATAQEKRSGRPAKEPENAAQKQTPAKKRARKSGS